METTVKCTPTRILHITATCFDYLSLAIVGLYTELNNEIIYMTARGTFLLLYFCVQHPGGGYGAVAGTRSCHV